ncbi:MAG: STAS domain-containing protein [Candidatus Omnitrophica bacterium]|nr:STAS domain-containing protein [Candidatus Omnitrophota bacterium]
MSEQYQHPSFIAQEVDDLIIVRLYGDFNQHTLHQSRKMIDEMMRIHQINERHNLSIIIDYQNVNDVDSSTIADILEHIEENSEHSHKVAFINVPDEFIKLLEIYKLQDKILVFKTEKEAIKALQQ